MPSLPGAYHRRNSWSTPRIEDIIERELKIAEREREISKREEQVNRREHDASRRESWIMEQLIALGNEGPQAAAVEEEYVYEPVVPKRKAKFQELPPIINEYEYGYGAQTKTIIQETTIAAPAPANTRLAPFPTPEPATSMKTESSPRTTAVEVIREEGPRTIVRPPARRAKPFPGW
ncbi:hypothetical protein NMY22_g18364 [Coprinellus aureogranulatus]|nr:hypothetical protein NMY22_g18364 [Coprinellus aureogranulatus]